MRTGFFAFFKKEWLELARGGKLFILLAVFVLFGIMNPAIAKLTPWLMEQMADELAGSGLVVSAVTADAAASWTQFFKNIPMAALLFIVLFGGSLANECERGTLIPLLTRGLSRHSVVGAKAALIALVWTAGYWLCFGITLGYNAYFWGSGENARIFTAALFPYLFGLWLIAMLFLFSVPAKTGTTVLAGLAALLVCCYAAGMLPSAARWLPTKLLSAQSIATGQEKAAEFVRASAVAAASGAAGYLGAVFGFERRRI